ncbi:N-acetylmuramoyl-L-alanine amidase [Cumulibacter manganitolerans]|uniref:N-acetylmuramoyl-L-alanine amidase n=1 Tax=Cumulibacter manganitolerans TaxID=1884992 RepID=UPI001886280D|nr:peptidoglycan-binding protein [Cumulibacter manganitolerans]
MMKTITLGDRGPSVIEVRSMLHALGLLAAGPRPDSQDLASEYDQSCMLAVRQFQQERGLVADGAVDVDTYLELTGAQYHLGDRVLRMVPERVLRGDDVRQLQQQLAELGFHIGNVDGIFALQTADSVRAFQSDYGLVADGECGPKTTRALRNLFPKVTGGSLSHLRSRAHRRSSGPELVGRHIYLDVASGDDAAGFTWNVGERVRDHLELLGANATLLDTRRRPNSAAERAENANAVSADLFVSVQVASHTADRAEGSATYYFGSPSYVSTVGREIAGLLHREVAARTPFVDLGVFPQVVEVLRLTRMPAVLLEVGHVTNPADLERMLMEDVRASVAEGIVAAIQRFYLDAPDEYPTGTWRIPSGVF